MSFLFVISGALALVVCNIVIFGAVVGFVLRAVARRIFQ